MIVPTVGRVVWYYRYGRGEGGEVLQPQAAIVTYVHNERSVNLAVFDRSGNGYGLQSVVLVQEGDQEPAAGNAGFCCWMPYQLDQAKKAAGA